MSSYPKWLYHATKAPQVVADEAARDALGAGWVESPVEARELAEKAAHRAEADEKPEPKPTKKVK